VIFKPISSSRAGLESILTLDDRGSRFVSTPNNNACTHPRLSERLNEKCAEKDHVWVETKLIINLSDSLPNYMEIIIEIQSQLIVVFGVTKKPP
jgi:hypothetical protein